MSDFRGQPVVCSKLARKGKLLAAALLLGVVLTGCGGGDDSSAAAPSSPRGTPPPNAGVAPGGAPTSPGGALADAGGPASDAGAVPPGDLTTPPLSNEEEEEAADAVGTGSVTLSWVPPTANDDGSALKLTGYKIYWGPSDGKFTHSVVVDNPGLTRYVVEQLAAGTWYFVATALSEDRESEHSNVFSMTVD